MSTKKKFDELNSHELDCLLKEYHTHKVTTEYGWHVPFSIRHFYDKMHKGFMK